MRYLFTIAVTLLLLTLGCSKDTENMHLSGTIKGLKKGTLLLQKFKDTVLVTVDSMVVEGNPEFSFSQKIESPEIYYLAVRLKDASLRDDRIAFFAETGEINIQSRLKNFGSAAQINGSKNDKAWREYLRLKDRYVAKNLNLIEEKLKLAKNLTDSALIEIDRKQRDLLSSKYLATINFAINHNELEVAPYVMLSEAYNANPKYLDTVYNALAPKIKNSKYGRELESFIADRKKIDSL